MLEIKKKIISIKEYIDNLFNDYKKDLINLRMV